MFASINPHEEEQVDRGDGEERKINKGCISYEAKPSSVFIQTNEIYKTNKQLLIQYLL